MDATNFFLKWNGKKLDFDGVYGAQCVDVIKQYFQDILKLPVFKGDAIDYWDKTPQGFTKITKTWYNQPLPGDIIVFNLGVNGHIAICNWSRLFDFGVFEQNNPIGSGCHFRDYGSYKGVLGWLRPNPVLVSNNGVIKVARVGAYLPPGEELIAKVKEYTKGKITLLLNDYNVSVNDDGMFTQDEAHVFIKSHPEIKESFVQVYYNSPKSVWAASYAFPDLNKIISTLPPGMSSTGLAYEFVNCLWDYCNDYLKAGLGYQSDYRFEDASFSANVQKKYDVVEPYLNKIV